MILPEAREFWAEVDAAVAAQDARPAPGYVTINARDIAIALNGYAGFTGDPVSFASELHERPSRTVFADQPKPAPEMADDDGDYEPGSVILPSGEREVADFPVVAASELTDAMTESKRYLEALKNVFAVLDRQALTYAERISYARTLIRTAQEGK